MILGSSSQMHKDRYNQMRLGRYAQAMNAYGRAKSTRNTRDAVLALLDLAYAEGFLTAEGAGMGTYPDGPNGPSQRLQVFADFAQHFLPSPKAIPVRPPSRPAQIVAPSAAGPRRFQPGW